MQKSTGEQKQLEKFLRIKNIMLWKMELDGKIIAIVVCYPIRNSKYSVGKYAKHEKSMGGKTRAMTRWCSYKERTPEVENTGVKRWESVRQKLV